MPPQQSIAAQWRGQMDSLLADSRTAREALDRELQQFTRAANDYRQAMDAYRRASAGESESGALLELAERANRTARRYLHRRDISDWQVEVEGNLWTINGMIGGTHLVIMAGKLAEIGLAVYGAVTEAGLQAAQVGSQAEQLGARVHAIERAESAVRATKPLEGLDVGQVADGQASPGNLGFRLAQVAIAVGGFSTKCGEAAKEIWEIAENCKEFTDWKRDGFAKAIVIVHIIRNLVSLGRPLIEMSLKSLSLAGPLGPSQATQAFYADIAAGPLLVLGVLKDGIEAFQEFLEALESFKQMGENAEAAERERARGDRFIGNPNAQAPTNVTRAEVERLLSEETRDFNSARVLGDAARKQAQRLRQAVYAADTLLTSRERPFRQSLQRVQPLVATVQELDQRLRMSLAGYGMGSDEYKRELRDIASRLEAERSAVTRSLRVAQDAMESLQQ